MRREVKAYKRAMRVETFAVDGTGTAAIGEGQYRGTLVDNGTGDYTVTFTEAFARVPCVSVGIKTADVIHYLVISATAVQVLCFDATDGTTAKDAEFDLIVIGSDVADQQ